MWISCQHWSHSSVLLCHSSHCSWSWSQPVRVRGSQLPSPPSAPGLPWERALSMWDRHLQMQHQVLSTQDPASQIWGWPPTHPQLPSAALSSQALEWRQHPKWFCELRNLRVSGILRFQGVGKVSENRTQNIGNLLIRSGRGWPCREKFNLAISPPNYLVKEASFVWETVTNVSWLWKYHGNTTPSRRILFKCCITISSQCPRQMEKHPTQRFWAMKPNNQLYFSIYNNLDFAHLLQILHFVC